MRLRKPYVSEEHVCLGLRFVSPKETAAEIRNRRPIHPVRKKDHRIKTYRLETPLRGDRFVFPVVNIHLTPFSLNFDAESLQYLLSINVKYVLENVSCSIEPFLCLRSFAKLFMIDPITLLTVRVAIINCACMSWGILTTIADLRCELLAVVAKIWHGEVRELGWLCGEHLGWVRRHGV